MLLSCLRKSLWGLAVLSVACGGKSIGGRGEDAGVGGTPGVGGSPTTPPPITGGSGARPASGGASTSPPSTNCGGVTCRDYMVLDMVSAPGCCPSGSTCGSDMSQVAAAIGVTLVDSCVPWNQPGAPDSTCAEVSFTNPVTGSQEAYPGCCMANGMCGNLVDLGTLRGPNLGCANPELLGNPSTPCGTTVYDAGPGPSDAGPDPVDSSPDAMFCPAPNTCDVCQQNLGEGCACADAIANCFDDPECLRIADCVTQSPDPNCLALNVEGARCVLACADLHPMAKDKYLAYERCSFCEYCLPACDAQTYCSVLLAP